MVIKRAYQHVGVHYYFFPTYTQVQKAIWEGIDNDGFRFLDHIPKEIIKKKNEKHLKIELINGSIIQFIGSDRFDSVRGTNPITCIFSEFAYQNPMIMRVIRPILKFNKGVAVFITTPFGKNHSHALHMMAKENPDEWFEETLTIKDTNLITDSDLDDDRREGMPEEMIQQEYYCSYETGMVGSYYADVIADIRGKGQIKKLDITDKPVDIYFDLGVSDSTAMWFKQDGAELNTFNFINHYENHSQPLEHYFGEIDKYLEFHGLKLGTIWMPHDSRQRDLITGMSVEQITIKRYGGSRVRVVEVGSILTGIYATRKILPNCFFDADACQQGILCLENYRKEYNLQKKIFNESPLHDWASHTSDSFRYFAVSQRIRQIMQKEVVNSYNTDIITEEIDVWEGKLREKSRFFI